MQYGRTWWGAKWLEAFNNIDFSNRLPRGRTYANRGSVSDIKIIDNTIAAKVQGSRRTPYKVKIEIQQFSSNTIKKVHEIINKSPAILAKLINRELSNSLLTKLTHEHIALFPSTWKDLQASCSCPDWAMPCKHIAAVIYLIAAEIDKNPFVIFTLHNCNLKNIIATSTKNFIQEVRTIPSFSKIMIETSGNKKSFDNVSIDFSAIDFSKIPELDSQICALLTKNPLFYEKDFKDVLHLAYKHWKRSPNKLNILYLSEEAFITQWSKVEQWPHITLVIDDSQECIEIRNDKKTSLSIAELIYFLDQLPSSRVHRLCQSMQVLHLLYHCTLKLIQNSAIIPRILTNNDNQYFIKWIPALFDQTINEIYQKLCTSCPKDLAIIKDKNKIVFLPTQQQILSIISVFASELINNNLPSTLSKYSSNNIFNLFFNSKIYAFNDFSTKEIPQTIALWLEKLYLSEKSHAIHVLIDDVGHAFSLQIKVELIKNKVTQLVNLSKIISDKQNDNVKFTILADLMLLCEYIPQLETLIDNIDQNTLLFTLKDFATLFLHALPILRSLGIKIILPKSLQKMTQPRVMLKLSSGDRLDKDKKTFLNLDQLLEFNWQIALGEQLVDIHEFKKLLQNSQGIVKIHDQYVIFDEQKIAAFLKKLEKLPNHLDRTELMQAGLSESLDNDIQVSYDRNIQQLFNSLVHYQPVTIPCNLHGQLRPYQEKGFNWLIQNITLGFGSILADDMGLGKTLQIITSILYLKNNGLLSKQKVLIVAPTSLLSNWQKEITRFAPDLNSVLYHGLKRTLSINEYDVVITSYGLARRDKSFLNATSWFLLVIDEAQNIKNYTTEQTKSIKNLQAIHKIAMSGTPVENRLSEYWSIFDFINKDYLGSIKDFSKNFAVPIEKEHNLSCLEKFSKITSPFILRRLKSDKSIINDLPDKIENNRYCNLTPIQAALYEEVTKMTLKKIKYSEGIERKGIIFSLLNSLKQICNHPSQYEKRQTADIESSGKMQMLAELLSSIDAMGEKTLIFTQYTQMGDLLQVMIEQHLGIKAPFLHGELSIKQRDVMVHDFQNLPHMRIMIVSLKAGGTGLNLTAANHVIHYDLWWNPAVEAQATDRAYRIGQQKNVMVYRLITSNTFEERINEMIQHKKELANLTVASGEQWITELTNAQLKDLISLRKEDT